MSELVIERGAGWRLTINRPDRRNALTRRLLGQLADAVDEAADDPRTRVVVITGAGGAFCAGADLADVSGLTPAEVAALMAAASRLVRSIVAAPPPVVALVRGPAVGYGASLAFACDLVLAAEGAAFRLPFTSLGLMPDGGALSLVAATAGRATAARLALLGDPLAAAAAEHAGLVARVFPDEDFDTECAAVVDALAAGPAAAYRQTKRALRQATIADLERALELEEREQAQLLLGADFAEAVAAFREHRAPRFAGQP